MNPADEAQAHYLFDQIEDALQSGAVDQARELIQQARKQVVGHLHLTYLDARLQYELGRPERAAHKLEKLVKKLESPPPTLLGDLAHFQFEAGQLKAAQRTLDRALPMLPEEPESARLWMIQADIAQERGNGPAHAKAMAQALRLAPDDETLWDFELSRLTEEDDHEAALAFAERLLNQFPQSVQANLLMGRALADSGDIDAAVDHLLSVSIPDSAYTAAAASMLLIDGQAGRCRELCDAWLARNPDSEDVRELSLSAALADGNRQQAISDYDDLIEQAPGSLDLHLQRAELVRQLHGPAQAMDGLLPLLDTDADEPALLNNLGALAMENGDRETATMHFHAALQRAPDAGGIHKNLGVLHLQSGDFNGARRELDQALQLDPLQSDAWQARAILGGGSEIKGLVRRIENLIPDPMLEPMERAELHFAAGQLLDRANQYDAAAAHIDSANSIRAIFAPFDLTAWERSVELASAITTAPSPPTDGAVRPLLVLGPPRSGTTLLARQLARAGLASGGREQPFWPAQLDAAGGGINDLAPFMEGLTPEAAAALAADYRTALGNNAPADATWVIDKMPVNFPLTGLLASLLPEARFIWCRRDARDVAVSNLFQSFVDSYRFSFEPDALARYLQDAERLRSRFTETVGPRLLTVDYEDWLQDPAAGLARVAEWLGTEASAAGDDVDEELISTASAWQVRQPLHQKSVGRWRHYNDHWPDLMARLG